MSERMARIAGTQDFALKTLFDVLEEVRELANSKQEDRDWDRVVGLIDRAQLRAKRALDERRVS